MSDTNITPKDSDTARPLAEHTFESVCAALCRGESIRVGGGEDFSLKLERSHALLAWYADPKNAKATTAGRNGSPTVRRTDIDVLVAIADKPAASQAVIRRTTAAGPKGLRLSHVRASNFGGLHYPSEEGLPPPDFTLALNRPLTLLRGRNGSGKTSVLNAVLYGLTGHLLRSQRAPEAVDAAGVEVSVVERREDEDGEASATIAPITPIPLRRAVTGAANLLDTTSVQLTITGNDEVSYSVRRTLSRSRTRFSEETEGFGALGLDAQALEVGTKMPAMLAHIRSGEVSDLGSAVARLTGLSRLQLIAAHAEKTANTKLRKDRIKELDVELDGLARQWRERAAAVNEAYEDRLESALPAELDSANAEELKDLLARLESRRKIAGGEIEELLEPGVLEASSAAPALKRACEQARGRLDWNIIGGLNAAQSLSRMNQISEKDLADAESTLVEIKRLAVEVREAGQSDADGERLRLYARVADWLKQGGHTAVPTDCPLCDRALEDVPDPSSGRLVATHLSEALTGDARHQQHTEKDLAVGALSRLKSELSHSLRTLAASTAINPRTLVSTLLGREIPDAVLVGNLATLANHVATGDELDSSDLEPFEKPTNSRPDDPGEVWLEFWSEAHRIEVAVAAVRWQQRNRKAYVASLQTLVGKPESADGSNPRSLHGVLNRAVAALEAVEPYRLAQLELKSLSDLVRKRAETTSRRTQVLETASALDPLIRLGDLAQERVNELVGQLNTRALYWKERLYKPATKASPRLHDVGVASSGRLELFAAREGVKIDAGHVSNSSDLRATLLALLFAYWEHVTDEGRGLGLLLLDDPQELMDPDNRYHLAGSICELASRSDARVVVTSNDRRFCDALVGAAGGLDSEKLHFAEVYPASDKRPCLSLQPLPNFIHDKRRAFERDEDNHQKARDYMEAVRVHVEESLRDLLDDVTLQPGSKPTLDPLLKALRQGHSQASGFLAEAAVSRLLGAEALREGADTRTLLNRAHHGSANTITWGEVSEVAPLVKRLLELLEGARTTQAAWLLRLPQDATPNGPPAPEPTEFTRPEAVPLFETTAALSGLDGGTNSEKGQEFKLDWFTGTAVYQLTKDKLGVAATVGSHLVVDPLATQADDNRIVIALHQDRVWARRLLRPRRNPDLAVLASEGTNPRARDGSVSLPFDEVTAMKVVGVLFGSKHLAPSLRDDKKREAAYREQHDLSHVVAALKVDADGVSPVALANQTILVGAKVEFASLANHVGEPIALRTSSGWALQRVGESLADSTVWLFPGLVASANAALARCPGDEPATDGWAGVDELLEVRLLAGVLFDPA